MPPRKEPKETVKYPASKRKGPAFKPQRPGKIPRVAITDSESSRLSAVEKPVAQVNKRASRSQGIGDENKDGKNPATAASIHKAFAPIMRSDSSDDDDDDDDDDEELTKDPLAKLKKAPATRKAAPSKRHALSEESRHDSAATGVGSSPPPFPPQADDVPQIPQALLVRILHEHFKDKTTKIDKHAIVVFQKYIEIFVREAIARAKLGKAEQEGIDADEKKWLDVDDLEKVAGHMMLEFG